MNSNKVLVVDDDEVIRKVVVSYLSEAGHTIYSAADGHIAEEIIKKEKPDLVITDVRMPEKDGIEILNYVKSLDCSIPVILMTAFDDVDVTIRCNAAWRL